MNEYLKDETEMSFESFDHGKYDICHSIHNYGFKYNIIITSYIYRNGHKYLYMLIQ